MRGAQGAVAAAHPLAVEAATTILSDGGTAVDAMIAAHAMICVAMPDGAGLGGDALALVRDPDGTVTAVNGNGTAPAAAVATYEIEGGTAVTVPGAVDGWLELHRRWGRLSLVDVLAPAIDAASNGIPVDQALADDVQTHWARLVRGGAADWPLLQTTAGSEWRQPELAALLNGIAEAGRDAFYAGPVAAAIATACRAGGGALDTDDLASHRTMVAAPLSTDWNGGTAYVQPPSSQGVLLAMALQWLEREANTIDLDSLDHLLVELTEAVFAHRDRCARGDELLSEALVVDRARAARRGGPRAYLHTAGVAVADRDGLVVSSLLSVFDAFGSGVYVPEGGFTLNNRAAGFTSGENAGAPGIRPVHTLAPALFDHPSGGSLAIATPGADGQIQTLLQIAASQRWSGRSLQDAIAAPRWRSVSGNLMIERGHQSSSELRRRGHSIIEQELGAELFGGVVAAGLTDGVPFAAGDWRRMVASGVA